MDTVKWVHSTGMEPDDVMVSDNLLDFVKDEDIVTSLDSHDDILPQGNLRFNLRIFFIIYQRSFIELFFVYFDFFRFFFNFFPKFRKFPDFFIRNISQF